MSTIRKTTAHELLAELKAKAAEEERRQKLSAVFHDTETIARFAGRSIAKRMLILLAMAMAGLFAVAIAAGLTRFGVSEKSSALAMTVAFFAAIVGGAWVYDNWR
jgi:hypothetical protein